MSKVGVYTRISRSKDNEYNESIENQIEGIKEQIRRGEELPDLKAPKLWINKEIKNFYDFDNSRKLEDIKIVDYEHYGKIEFPIAQ